MTALMTIKAQISAAAVSFLEMKARRITKLSDEWASNTINIGEEYKQARGRFPSMGEGKTCKRPGWHEWIETHTPWSVRQASKFIQIADRCGKYLRSSPTSARIKGKPLAFEVLTILSYEDTPDPAVKEVINRARGGENISIAKAKEIVQQHLPTRAQAIKEAQETGKLVPARDGHMYSGVDDQQAAAYSERRSSVYRIRDAIKEIAECGLTPTQWVKQAEDRWLHDLSLGEIEAAAKWLDKLQAPLEARTKVVTNGKS